MDGRGRGRAGGWAAAVCAAGMLGAGCGDQVPITTGGACSHGELVESGEWFVYPYDVLVVVEPGVRQALAPKLLELVRARLQEQDLESERNDNSLGGVGPWVRVAVVSAAQAVALRRDRVRCGRWRLDRAEAPECEVEVAFAERRHAPYGLAQDLDQTLARLDCVLEGAGDWEGEPAADAPAFGEQHADVVVVTTRDACAAGEQAGPACDGELTALLEALGQEGPNWRALVLGGIGVEGLPSGEESLSDQLVDVVERAGADPRVVRGGDALCASPVEVRPTPELLRALPGSTRGLWSACAEDYAVIWRFVDSRGWVDSVPSRVFRERLQSGRDGTAECTYTELLPASGPVTRCAQLSAHGRVRVGEEESGRERCEIGQLAEPDPHGSGWWLAPATSVGSRGDLERVMGEALRFIPGAQYEWRCVLRGGGELPSCEAGDAGAWR